MLRALQLPLIAPIVAKRTPGPGRVQALAARSVWRDIGAGTGPDARGAAAADRLAAVDLRHRRTAAGAGRAGLRPGESDRASALHCIDEMKPMTQSHAIETTAQLEALFGQPGDAALKKEVPYLHPAYQALIAASPFAVLATIGPGGLDASPRGDPPGFVVVQDEKTLLLPERRGNNRIDSLRNIVADPRVALLFLIPGVGETLRVNGSGRHHRRARASGTLRGRGQAAAVRARDPRGDGVLPVRARDPALQAVGPGGGGATRTVPTPGAMLSALTERRFDGGLRPRTAGAAEKNALLRSATPYEPAQEHHSRGLEAA